MPQWYHGEHGQQHGPVDDAVIRQWIASGHIHAQTLMWRDGMPSWLPMHQIPEFNGSVPTPAYPGYPAAPYQTPHGNPYMNPYGASPATSGLAVTSMVLGIVQVCLCYFFIIASIPAVICGHLALIRIGESNVPMMGRGMAIAGLVLGYLGILAFIGFISAILFQINL